MRSKIQNSNIKSQKFLEEIIKLKRLDLSQKNRKTILSDIQVIRNSESTSVQSFLKICKQDTKKIALIAELKFASPTNPNLGSSDELIARAKQYESAGADAISIITEKHFFKGDLSFISKVKEAVSLPILQKDFIIDSPQIYEAKEAGAEALLLIARLVDTKVLQQFVDLCFVLHIEPVVEINNEEDLEKAVKTKTNIIAVNARDLETFEIDVQKACSFIKKIPERFVKLGFSGIHSQEEVIQYRKVGAKGILVGTSLMKARDIKSFIKSLAL